MMTKIGCCIFSVALVLSLSVAGCGDDDGQPATETLCSDTEDNDGDGLTDCDDPDCVDATECQGPVCGDNVIDDGEDCDGDELGEATCQSAGYDDGTLTCSEFCGLDLSDCFDFETCGDDQAGGDEECDGDDFDGQTCSDFGFSGGSLTCDEFCTVDDSGCFDSLDTCTTVGSTSIPMAGTLTCATETGTSIEWDWYHVAVIAGDCVYIFADNGVGAADLLALAVDPDGETSYGLTDDYSQLDDERDCSTDTWAGFECPEASVVAESDGDMVIMIGQWAGDGTTPGMDTCNDGMSEYTLYVAVNGTDATPILDSDDTAMM